VYVQLFELAQLRVRLWSDNNGFETSVSATIELAGYLAEGLVI
jgi:hypothetical protein